jgi:murein DD-endopeptidase MepM/ murein hydrolase activator NlpD
MKLLTNPLGCKLDRLRVNRTLHGRSVYRKIDVPGHNVVNGYSRPGTKDGVDLFCPAGTPVMATHAGVVTRVADRDGLLGCIYIKGQVRGHEVLVVLAHLHIKDAVVFGSDIEDGQIVGYVGRKLKDPHLHLEVVIDGVPISGRTAKKYVAELVKIVK